MRGDSIPRVFLAFVPIVFPAICACINPHIFDTALGLAGGYGEAALNGALPPLLLYFASKKITFLKVFQNKVLMGILYAFSVYIALVETVHLFSA